MVVLRSDENVVGGYGVDSLRESIESEDIIT
jgi:hypothetical protein